MRIIGIIYVLFVLMMAVMPYDEYEKIKATQSSLILQSDIADSIKIIEIDTHSVPRKFETPEEIRSKYRFRTLEQRVLEDYNEFLIKEYSRIYKYDEKYQDRKYFLIGFLRKTEKRFLEKEDVKEDAEEDYPSLFNLIFK